MSSQVSACMYSEWMLSEEELQVTDDNGNKEKNDKKKEYKHVPHRDKPAQVVARRNARERRRVQAVNLAFAKLRKVVPVENSRGKRISKVKTLHYAIDYIHGLLDLLEQDRNYRFLLPNSKTQSYTSSMSVHNKFQSHYYSHRIDEDFFGNLNFADEL